MTTSISSLFEEGLFCKYNFVVSQLKHLTPLELVGFWISNMCSTIFSHSKLTMESLKYQRFRPSDVKVIRIRKFECVGKTQFLCSDSNVQMFNICVNFKDTKKIDHKYYVVMCGSV